MHAVDRHVVHARPRARSSAIVGESGCGKSVTCMSLVRLLPRDRARQRQRRASTARDLLDAAAEARCGAMRGKDISVVFQEPMTSLNPALTVGRQIAEVLRRHLGLVATRRRRAGRSSCCELVGIPAPERRVDEYPHQLSGGMRQRVMIAMAVACDPEGAHRRRADDRARRDHPGRDPRRAPRLRERLGTAIVLITHDLGVVADIADRVVVMYAGRRVEEAPVDELFAQPQHPYTIGLLGALPGRRRAATTTRRRLREIPGRVPRCASSRRRARSPPAARAPTSCRARRPRSSRECGPGHPVACYHPGAGRQRVSTNDAAYSRSTDLVKHFPAGGVIGRRRRCRARGRRRVVHVGPGEVLGLVGESGSGKSTVGNASCA